MIKKEILHIDMDHVLADFQSAYDSMKDQHEYPQSVEGFFLNLEPLPDAIETVKELMNHYDVWILTRPSYMNPLCYTEKRLWVEKYFGLEFCKKLNLVNVKSMMKGDYLIDDSIKDGQLDFEGTFLHFGTQYKDWKEIKTRLISLK